MSFEQAKELYCEACEDNRFVPMIAANTSEMVDGVWHLENGNGPLARVYPDGRVDFS